MIPWGWRSESRGIDAWRGSDGRGAVLLRRHRGADPGEASVAGDAAIDQRGARRARRGVFGALRGVRAPVDPAGAIAAGYASAASLFDPVGTATGRTAGVRHAVSLVRRAVDRREGFDASTFS